MVDRALILHLPLPAWTSRTGLDEAWDLRFGPLLRGLTSDRDGRAGLLLCGRLVEDLTERHPELAQRLRQGLAAGRFELIATALHGPVLSAIPERDALDQLTAHTTLLKRVLGARPTGGWMPQGVWDPSAPRWLSKAGLPWTTLERGWLERVGAPGARLSVEREGRAVAVLPHGSIGEGWSGLAVLRVDRPEDAARALSAFAKADRLPSSLVEGLRRRAYLPAGGPNGLWETVLLDDPGADALHKRMLSVSRLVRRLDELVSASTHSDDGPDPQVHQQARRYLHRAQAAEAYGPTFALTTHHGAHRDRAWRDLLRAEAMVERALELARCDGVQSDADCDGAPELRLRTRRWCATLAPARSGALTELSERKIALNVLGGAEPTAFRETWGDGAPVAGRWELVTSESPGDGSMRALLVADSALGGVPVRLTKALQVPDRGAIELRIEVANRGLEVARGWFRTELQPVLGGPRLDEQESASLAVEVAGGNVPLDETIELPDLDAFGLVGWRARLEIELSPAGRVRITPAEQGAASVLVTWPIELLERDRERREIRLQLWEVPRG